MKAYHNIETKSFSPLSGTRVGYRASDGRAQKIFRGPNYWMCQGKMLRTLDEVSKYLLTL